MAITREILPRKFTTAHDERDEKIERGRVKEKREREGESTRSYDTPFGPADLKLN